MLSKLMSSTKSIGRITAFAQDKTEQINVEVKLWPILDCSPWTEKQYISNRKVVMLLKNSMAQSRFMDIPEALYFLLLCAFMF